MQFRNVTEIPRRNVRMYQVMSTDFAPTGVSLPVQGYGESESLMQFCRSDALVVVPKALQSIAEGYGCDCVTPQWLLLHPEHLAGYTYVLELFGRSIVNNVSRQSHVFWKRKP